MRRALLVFFFVVWLGGLGRAVEPARVVPLPVAHAHNDYEHARPLFDALERGFCHVEADVWLVEGQLLVAHDRKSVRADRTLTALYLEPLRARIRRNGGRVFRDGPVFTLLIDIKSPAAPTYAEIDRTLREFAEILTMWRGDRRERESAVTVIISGNRPRAEMQQQPERFAAFDGRAGDLASEVPAAFMPWISENWRTFSSWNWNGAMPEADRERLREWVAQAHARGRKLRLWNVPERADAWQLLSEAGVDILGADDLDALAAFLRSRAAPRNR